MCTCADEARLSFASVPPRYCQGLRSRLDSSVCRLSFTRFFVSVQAGASADARVYGGVCVCAPAGALDCFFSQLDLFTPPPLFAKRLNPTRPVTVLLVKRASAFPPVRVCLSVCLPVVGSVSLTLNWSSVSGANCRCDGSDERGDKTQHKRVHTITLCSRLG